MRKRSKGILILAAVMAAAACASDLASQKVRLEIPGKAEIPGRNATEIVLAGFWSEAGFPGLDLDAEISEHLRNALGREYRGRLTDKDFARTGGAMPDSPEAWKAAAPGPAGALVLAGKASFSAETRKALLEAGGKTFDGPWDARSPWAERRNFSLNLEIVILDAETGREVFRKEYRESINTENLKATPAYVLHALLDRAAPKLLSALFGTPRTQDRYLLTK